MHRREQTGRRAGRSSREEFWRELLRECAAGGQSIRAFCAARGVSEPSFYAWRRRLGSRPAASCPDAVATAPTLLPVSLTHGPQTQIEIVLAGGHRIRLRGPVDREALAEVLAALGRYAGRGEEA
jgi:transposase